MQNEIICYAQDYKDVNKLNNLVNSFLLNCDDSCLTILYKNMECEKHITVPSRVKFINVKDLDLKYNVETGLSPYTLKVIYFYLYCKHVTTSNNVFLCDATDVYINKNIFSLPTDKATVFIEDEKIGRCPVNTQWVKTCYNEDIYNILKPKDILNGGLIYGSRAKCVDLLHEMVLELTGIISRIGNYQNPDQAALNKVVYFDEYNYNISKNHTMINCAHLNNTSPKVEFINKKIYINNELPCVVHQYQTMKGLSIVW